MAEMQQSALHSAALMVGTRLVNMAVGLIAIPVLIRYLGGTGFAAWAVLLALAAGFSLLEFGMPTAIVRFASVPAQDGNWKEVRSIFGGAWAILAVSFGAGLMGTLWFAVPFSAWLRLPDMVFFTAAESICVVFAAAAIKAFLQSGTHALYAARRFSAASTVALLQPLCSNLAAMVAAWRFGRLDVVLVSYWSAQLGVLGVTLFLSRHMCVPRIGRDTLHFRKLRELCVYGLTSQLDNCAQFVNFQFDKFIVAGLVGLWAVAPYEVANRGVVALRSIPASGAETFLPTAMTRRASEDDAWDWYVSSTRIAAYGAGVFMLAPLAVAPMFLYAWTGEMGYVGRWAFVALTVGAMASILSYPAVTLAQAAGRPGFQARAAAIAIMVNVPLSLLLVTKWGLVGAAVGTGAAMSISAAQLLDAVHKYFGRPLKVTFLMLARFWPLLLVCACWGALTFLMFNIWFATLDPGIRYSRVTRAYPGLIAVGIYAMCLLSMFLVEWFRGAFTSEERAFLTRVIGFKWLAKLASGRKKG